ncbi:2-phosphosulfolactate phosphatase [Desulfovibrio inopinatus]|uniref:2-phosphosulfolactate phosphatase n=1 Tax=Desulfovibrio inopinatus TaxID=102109 RepID=UPI00041B0567|nr:2-phosphosulfolactate phosphatase [Desulfovibrio inopinatus]
MQITIRHGMTGAKMATGVAVVVDVFNASTTAVTVLERGAARVLAVADPAQALTLRKANPDWLLVGESADEAISHQAFDLPNSPHAVMQCGEMGFNGKTVVLSTLSGSVIMTEMVENEQCDIILTCGFVNMGATVRWLHGAGVDSVTLIPAGGLGGTHSPEDAMCAMYLKNELETFPNVMDALVRFLRGSESAERFWGDSALYNESDFNIGVELDRFSSVVSLEKEATGIAVLKKLDE